MWMLWIIFAVVFIVIEIIYNGFFFFWFSIGSLIALLTSFCTSNIILQTFIFLISSIILAILFTKRMLSIMDKGTVLKVNTDALIGQIGVVIKEIPENGNGLGQVKVSGQYWSAISENGNSILEGSKVVVMEIRGVKLIVSSYKETI